MLLRMISNILMLMCGAVGAGAMLLVLAGLYAPVLDRVLALCLLVLFLGAIFSSINDLARGE